MEGWIKLHRQLLNSTVFQNERLLKLWIWILIKATHEESKTRIKMQEIILKPGQFVLRISSAVKELKMPRTTIYRLLDVLESEQRLNKKRDGNGTVVTIENWAVYQCGDIQDGTLMGRQWDASGTHNKNVKNDKNINNNNTHIRAYTHAREEKVQCADYVWLTTDQYAELVARFGEVDADRLIAILDNHKRGSKKEYADDYRAIFSWCVDRLQKNKNDGVYQDDEDDEYLRMLQDINERKQRSKVEC